METYKNDYTKEEDEALWELHEIRHKLSMERKNKTLEEINSEGRKLFETWTNQRQKTA